jgi:hypothetical protein
MDEVGPGFQPAGAFQAPRRPLIPNAAQKTLLSRTIETNPR